MNKGCFKASWLLGLFLLFGNGLQLGCANAKEQLPTLITPTFTRQSTAISRPTAPPTIEPALPKTATTAPMQTATRQPTETAVIPPSNMPTPLPTPTFVAYGITQTIGFSVESRPIVSHRFGFGTKTITLIGGMHGGYEWNTILLSYQLIDYFKAHNDEIPSDITLYIVPSVNLDGQHRIAGTEGRFSESDLAIDTIPGRFNGHQVDLNRNWGCNWAAEGYWGERVVDPGKRPFSEPESNALRHFLLGQRANIVVFFHSAADGIFPGGCPEPLTETTRLANIYSFASDYPLFASFSSYPVTGDASDWLAGQNIPAFSIELKDHEQIEFEENLAGVKALINELSSP